MRSPLSQYLLNALCLSERDPKSVRGVFEGRKRRFDCDLAAHLLPTLDRLNSNCNRF